jgi:hypothetical protein
MHRATSIIAFAAFFLSTSAAANPVHAQNGDSKSTPPPPNVTAAPATGHVGIDGVLNEPAWLSAPAASDFRQSQPDEGEPATQRTEVRFLFDGEAIYVGARMYDELGSAGVVSRLARRDADVESDLLVITFDTFHDHLGQTQFSVNPAGVKGDAIGQGGSWPDPSWDPVWEAATTVDSLGWIAELKIPFSQLRFPRDSVQAWGMQLVRTVNRLNERSQWTFWPVNESGGPARYGHLEALAIHASPSKAEVLPYVVGRASTFGAPDLENPFDRSRESAYRFGADFKYLLTSNLTLTGTVNPDFGQVEVDPAVVNLSAFETYFPERRPFFVEGRGYLGFGGLNCFFCSNVSGLSLFYSRRIGRSPQGSSNAWDAGDYADVPGNTTIVGAAKITGRTSGGWSVGILNAVTSREHARVIHGADQFDTEVEPLTNYFAGRVKKDMKDGNVVVGGMLTSVYRDLADPQLATQLNRHAEGIGADASIWWADRKYRLWTHWAVSQIAGDSSALLRAQRSSARYFQRPDRKHGGNGLFSDRFDESLTSMRGFAGYARLSKESGDWRWEVSANLRSPGFEANDMAFLTRADYLWMNANVFRRWTKPTSWYRRMHFVTGGQQQFNFDGDRTDLQMQAAYGLQTLSYWWFDTFFIHRPSVLDDRLTRGGPIARRASSNYWYVSVSSDSRKNISFWTGPSYSWTADGSRSFSVNLGLTFRPASYINLDLSPRLSHSESAAQYVTAADDPTAVEFYGRRYVFADIERKSVSMNTRLNITFTPTLTLEVFAQPFIATGRYSQFKEFAQPRRLEKRVYGSELGRIFSFEGEYTVDPDHTGPAEQFSFSDPDFNVRSLRGNAVLRWEFQPGSTLFLVWTQSRSAAADVGTMDFGRDLGALFDAPADNVFLVKVNYWLGM